MLALATEPTLPPVEAKLMIRPPAYFQQLLAGNESKVLDALGGSGRSYQQIELGLFPRRNKRAGYEQA